DGDGAGVGAGQTGGAEGQGDIGGNVVREIDEAGHAIRGRGAKGALQGAAASTASGGDRSAAVGAEVGKLVADLQHRLVGEGYTRRGRGRRLGLHGQSAGGAGHFTEPGPGDAGGGAGAPGGGPGRG